MFSANPQPSGSLFSSNSTQKQPSSGGNLFANQSLESRTSLFSDRPQSSLFSIPNHFQRSAPSTSKEVPIHGTVDYIGRSHVHQNPSGESFVCITGTIKNCCLEELRIQDHFNRQRNLLPPTKKQLVETTIWKNIGERFQKLPNVFNPSNGQKDPFLFGGIAFGRPQSSPQTAEPFSFLGDATDPQKTFGGSTQSPKTFGNPFVSSQSAATSTFGMKPAQASQNTPQNTQIKGNIPKRQEFSNQPVQQLSNKKLKEKEVSRAERSPEKQSIASKPSSFSYEVNKMVLVSGFISLLQNHGVSTPEDVLDNTDFVPQLFKFLEQYKMNLPTENIPRFPLNTLTSLSNPQSRVTTAGSRPQTSSRRRRNTKRASQKACDRQSQEEKLPLKEVPMGQDSSRERSVSVIEIPLNVEKKEVLIQVQNQEKSSCEARSLLSFVKEEEGEEKKEGEEKVDVRDETDGDQKDQDKDEEIVIQSCENGSSEKGMVSVDFSDDSPSDDE